MRYEYVFGALIARRPSDLVTHFAAEYPACLCPCQRFAFDLAAAGA
jgi:hypothetical protein